MEESILKSVKLSCGIVPEYTAFDNIIVMHTNSVFMILCQMGIGPSTAFHIEDNTAVWTDFIPEKDPNFESVKTYVGAKVRIMFDPPTSSIHMECLKQIINELEWRLYTETEIESESK